MTILEMIGLTRRSNRGVAELPRDIDFDFILGDAALDFPDETAVDAVAHVGSHPIGPARKSLLLVSSLLVHTFHRATDFIIGMPLHLVIQRRLIVVARFAVVFGPGKALEWRYLII